MQVKATATAPVSSLLIECQNGDFDSTGPVAVYVAPVIALSREDLIAALLLAEVAPEVLADMDDAEVRHQVGFVLAADGLAAVHNTVYHERGTRHDDEIEAQYVALCTAKVTSAFSLTTPPATRSRAASRSIGTRRTLATVAA